MSWISDLLGIKTQTDKLPGAAVITEISASINWNTATATSGLAGEDLVTIGGAGILQELLFLDIDTSNLTAGAVVNVRLYDDTAKIYNDQFVMQADAIGSQPRILAIGGRHIRCAIRVEFYSDTSESKVLVAKYRLRVL